MNLLILHGNLGRDPESRTLPSGDTVASFSLAVKGRNKDDGPLWARVSVWGKQGDTCMKYLRKGSEVIVTGSLSYDLATGGPKLWESNTGETKSSFEVFAQRVEFAGGKPASGSQDTETRREEVVEDDSIPF